MKPIAQEADGSSMSDGTAAAMSELAPGLTNHPTTLRYPELDALRGLAAVMVVLFHFTLDRPEARLGFRLGATGVDLFFILSGFVIVMSLSRVHSVREFIINRVARLFPTYWAVVTFTFLVKTFTIGHPLTRTDLTQYLGNLTMFQYYMRIPNLDDPYWTMIIEMLFYLVMIGVLAGRLIRWLEPLGLLAVVGAAIGSVFFATNRLVFYAFGYVPLLQFAPLFLAGVIFYRLHSTKSHVVARYLALLICLGSQYFLFQYGRSRNYIAPTEYLLLLTLYFSLFTLFVTGKLTFLVSRVTLFFGKISFALYLIHEYVSVNVVIPFLTERLHWPFWGAVFGGAFPLTVLLAYLITTYVELPGGRQLRQTLHRLSA